MCSFICTTVRGPCSTCTSKPKPIGASPFLSQLHALRLWWTETGKTKCSSGLRAFFNETCRQSDVHSFFYFHLALKEYKAPSAFPHSSLITALTVLNQSSSSNCFVISITEQVFLKSGHFRKITRPCIWSVFISIHNISLTFKTQLDRLLNAEVQFFSSIIQKCNNK